MYVTGDGVSPDYVAAYTWLTLAAAQQTETARENALEGRQLAAQRMTPAQITEAKRRAQEWRPVRER